MSIILDALKRSDRERRLQKPPDLSQIYQENHPPRRNPMVRGILIIVVLIAGVSGAYLLIKKNPEVQNTKLSETTIVDVAKKKTQPEKQKALRNFSAKSGGAATIQKKKSPEAVPQKSVPSVTKRRRPKPQEDNQDTDGVSAQDTRTNDGRGNFLDAILAKGIKKKEEMAAYGEANSEGGHPLAGLFSTRHKSKSESTGAEATVVPSTPPPTEAPSVPDPQIEAPPPGRDSTEILSTPKGLTIIEPESAKVDEASKSVSENPDQNEAVKLAGIPVPTEPGKENSAVAPGKKKIVLVDDLPYETRQKYEDLQINVHIYDENKEERRVFINMHSYKEGEKIEEGLTLVAIIPEGIIVDYGDGKVQMNVKK